MICKETVSIFCCEDISLIENYNKAIEDKNKVWHCHHRLEIQDDKIITKQELINLNLYYHRPASELIFLTETEHKSLHLHIFRNNGITTEEHRTLKTKKAISETMKGVKKTESHKLHMQKQKNKYKWLTPLGEIKEMSSNHAHRYHPDWKLIEESF